MSEPVSPIRVGILGAARVAAYAMIAPAKEIGAAVTVQAIAARDPARARAFAETHAIPSVHDTYDALLHSPDIDLVYVATPPVNHAELAIKALKAGKPVLIEKPIAMTAKEAQAILQTANETGLPALEAFHWRHHALAQRLLALAPRLGALNRLEARFDAMIAPKPEEFRWNAGLGGGALMDLGCYCVHWLRTVIGGEPAVVRARMDIDHDVDVTSEAELLFPGGVEAHLHCSMQKPRRTLLWVEGEHGVLEVDNPLAPQLGHRLRLTVNGQRLEETLEGEATFTAQLRAVAAHLRHGGPFLVPLEGSVKNMESMDAIRAAAL